TNLRYRDETRRDETRRDDLVSIRGRSPVSTQHVPGCGTDGPATSAGRGRDGVGVLLQPRPPAVAGGQDGVDRRRAGLGADDPAGVGRDEVDRGGAEQPGDRTGGAEVPPAVGGLLDVEAAGRGGQRGERD